MLNYAELLDQGRDCCGALNHLHSPHAVFSLTVLLGVVHLGKRMYDPILPLSAIKIAFQFGSIVCTDANGHGKINKTSRRTQAVPISFGESVHAPVV
jgi:hypothetical protein